MPALIHSPVVVEFGRLAVVSEEGIAITVEDALDLFPAADYLFRGNQDRIEVAEEICDSLRDGCELRGSHEHLFLLLYFSRVVERLRLKAGSTLRSTLLPLPKARFSFPGLEDSVVVDFAFWTGRRFVAVFIHETDFDQQWPVREGFLKLWGFDVFCLKAEEFETRGLMGDTGLKILEALWLR